jgi:uncharacterized RDD family membrane protein YckC
VDDVTLEAHRFPAVSWVFRPCYVAAMPAPTEPDTQERCWPGQRLGLPENGPGAVGGWGRRLLALLVDWVLCELVASVILVTPVWATGNRIGLLTLIVFGVEVFVLTVTLGGSAGQLLLRLRVLRLSAPRLGVVRGLLRTVLLCGVVPAVIYDRDQRGLHDRAADSIVVRR